MRDLERFTVQDVDGRSYAVAEYDSTVAAIHLFATHVAYPQLDDAARALAGLIAGVPADHDVVVDFFVHRETASEGADAVAATVRGVLDGVGFQRPLRRIVAVVTTEGHGPGIGDVRHFTFRPARRTVSRGARVPRPPPDDAPGASISGGCANFDDRRACRRSRTSTSSTPSPARTRRTSASFALAEVRDVTPVRDAAGRVVALPAARAHAGGGLDGIRRVPGAAPAATGACTGTACCSTSGRR